MSTSSGPSITRIGGYPTAVPPPTEKTSGLGNYMNVGAILLWIVLFTFIWILIVSFAPHWCCDHEREYDDGPHVNYSKAAMYAFFISLIILVIIVVLFGFGSGRNSQC